MNALARPEGAAVAAVATAHAAREVLTFRLGQEEYGIDILRVQEIRSYERPTRIAGAPSFVLGASNLRGVIVPIADLRLKFGLSSAACDGVTATIVLNVAGRVVGVVVDQVCDVVALAAAQILPPPAIAGAESRLGIDGIGSITSDGTERMVLLLDIERLVLSAEMGLVEAG